jgi:dCTP deaminase
MTDLEVKKALKEGRLGIEGFDEACLQGTSYDVRIGSQIHISNSEESITFEEGTRTARLQPGEFALLITHERFRLPLDMAANIGPKTYFTRKGLILLAGLQVDPGFKGALALAVFNSSPKTIVLEHMQEICSLQFFQLNLAATVAPPVNRDLEQGRIPRVDQDYFRELETQSLTEVGRELKKLAINVGQLTENVEALSRRLTENVTVLSGSITELRQSVGDLRRVVWALAFATIPVFLGIAFQLFFR